MAGLAAFALAAVMGLAALVGAILLIPPDVPNATEAYECMGDAVRALLLLALGVPCVLLGAIFAGCKVARWAANRN